MDKDTIITILWIIAITALIVILSGCAKDERSYIDICKCKCKDAEFECGNRWMKEEHEINLNNIQLPNN